jgi:Tfp pilus assembly protein PilZ
MAADTNTGSYDQGFGEAGLFERRSLPARPMAERRAVLRYAVELPVTVTSERSSYDGLLRDMGIEGVFVATHRAHAIGEWIELNIKLPDGGPPVRTVGDVRWTREYAGEGAREPGIGVQFRSISPQDGARIAMFLCHCEALAYED